MCYGDDARPPAPPIANPIGHHGDLVLTSADGTRFAAYEAHPQAPSSRGIVVLPDVRGLHHFYKELAQRFAEAGVHAVAIDYFGRSAGLTGRDEDFEYRPHVDQLDYRDVTADASAACDVLRETTGATAVFTVGFCMGGAMSWRQSASPSGYAGNIGFYGIPSRVTELLPEMRSPLLILAAGQDFTPVAETEKFADEVRAVGPEVDMTVYPDAPHSFFDRTFGEHADDCADAWRQMLAFMDKHAA
ncbi:MAG TPA: dienelactone hydrolase family protein [Micromonosporaceae bacterium]|nr:dienelactone hydrolase family protein [Micromonosporaceae bacterium]